MKFLITFFFIATLFHGDNLATYTITKTNNSIKIMAQLDASDLEKALGSNSFNKSNEKLLDYLSNNMSYAINNQEATYVVNAIETNHHHVTFELLIHNSFETISDIKIKNKLLFNVNSEQSNVVEIRFDGIVKDFLINKDKPILNINLD